MNSTGQTRKLAELRAKTDRQLLNYLSAQLDRAMAMAEAGERVIEAEKIYAEVHRLFAMSCSSSSDSQWRAFLSRLGRLRQLLDTYSLTACVA
jgi:hypothetical protein